MSTTSQNPNLFNDYDGFVEKFKPKKTTDDCYTPPLVYEAVSDLWAIPGGGIDVGETPEKCCVRETEEETGNLVLPLQEFTTLFEYYEEYCYITHYFICEVMGSGRMNLTEAEVHRGAGPKWIPFSKALGVFSCHQLYADDNEEKRGIYLREYTAICEYLEECPPVRDAMPSSFKT